MDPIHPIIPVAPGLTPLNPPPRVGAVQDQDGQRQQDLREKRRKREKAQTRDRAGSYWDPSDAGESGVAWEPTGADTDVDEDDGHPHIDITA